MSSFSKFLLSMTVIFSGFTTVHAESGYRVCGAFAYVPGSGQLTKGLVTKVSKGNGGDTCGKKVSFMTNYYANAYKGEKADQSMKMITCEDFSNHMGISGDICRSMQVNKIYKYNTIYDRNPAVKNPTVTFWHN
ncbi:hypothetical protein OZX61_04685 [Acinetobacter sp. ESL0695]|uniref:hypothetical protein n=1 Tax=Acinetobacter sp. ESL0695 TaxID=2983215 RepID=UPI0023EF8709|nr:hypothetical protein [Acinetobacter sp. ESL0695]WEV49759.1 hypothetical protein OZX61_04685 [Acinetobacter sp. ESL0695]